MLLSFLSTGCNYMDDLAVHCDGLLYDVQHKYKIQLQIMSSCS